MCWPFIFSQPEQISSLAKAIFITFETSFKTQRGEKSHEQSSLVKECDEHTGLAS